MTGPPLRVAIFSLQFLPRIGGAETQALTFARALLARGHDARVFTLRYDPRWPRYEVIQGAPVTRLGGVTWGGRLRLGLALKWISFAVTFAALWRARRAYDVIHVTQVTPWAGVAALVGRLAGKPVFIRCSNTGPEPDDPAQEGRVVWLYPGLPDPAQSWRRVAPASWVGGDISNLKRYRSAWRLALWLMRGPNTRFLSTTRRMATYLARHGIVPARIAFMPNITVAPAAPANQAPAQTVTCVARHSYEKGVDVLLYAWRIVLREAPDARLRLVGNGPLTPALHRLADDLGLGDSVVWLGKRADVADMLQQTTVFALPSRWEGLPNALLEAMAAGLPCVATRVSGSEDVIVDEQTGLLVPPLDSEALARAIVRLLRDPALARSCGAAARRLVQTTLNAATLVERYESLAHP